MIFNVHLTVRVIAKDFGVTYGRAILQKYACTQTQK